MEELQSTNEELVTVNDPLQTRNLELSVLSDDLANVLHCVQMPVVILDVNRKIRRFSPAAETLLELKTTDIGRTISQIVINIEKPDLGQLLAQVVETLSPREFEIQDSEKRWHLLRVRPYRTFEKKLDGWVLSFTDINEIKRLQQDLAVQSALTSAVLGSVSTPTLVKSRQGRIIRLNQACLELTGYSAEELIGKDFVQTMVWPEDVEKALRADHEAFDRPNGPAPVRTEYRWRHKRGYPRLLQFWELAVRDGVGGAATCVVQSGIDITDQREVEAALRNKGVAIRASHDELRALAAGLIGAQEHERRCLSQELHDDVNQRLALLSIAVNQLEECIDQATMRTGLRQLRQRTDQLSDDIRRIAYALHPSALEDLGLAKSLKSLAAEFNQGKMKVRYSFLRKLSPYALSPEAAVGVFRIVQEALTNAQRHSGAHIATVRADAAKREFRLSISDDGCGFDPVERRAKGLGLIAMTERALMVGGALSIDSLPGKGTRIELRIPLQSVKKGPPPAPGGYSRG